MSSHREVLDIHKLEPGDIILNRDRFLIPASYPIKLANYLKRGYRDRGWVHAAVYAGDDRVIEALPQGIIERNFSDAYLDGRHDLIILRRKHINKTQVDKFLAFCHGVKGRPYNSVGTWYFALYNLVPMWFHYLLEAKWVERVFNVKGSYFCSALAAAGLYAGECYCFERKPYKVMPIDFDNDLLFDRVATLVAPDETRRGLYFAKRVFLDIFYFCGVLLIAGAAVGLASAVVSLHGVILAGIILKALLATKKKREEKR